MFCEWKIVGVNNFIVIKIERLDFWCNVRCIVCYDFYFFEVSEEIKIFILNEIFNVWCLGLYGLLIM